MVPYILLITYVLLLFVAKLSYRRFFKSKTQNSVHLNEA